MAEAVHVMSDRSFADRRVIVVRVGNDIEYSRVQAFTGPTRGLGPIFFQGYMCETRVDAPERFGDTFGPEWVHGFYNAPADSWAGVAE